MNSIKTIRLVLGAEQITNELGKVPDEYAGEVETARAALALMRGTDVVAAVSDCLRSGLSLALDLRPTIRFANKERPARFAG